MSSYYQTHSKRSLCRK